MPETLTAFIAQIAAHVAHERDWSLAEATAWVELHIEEAREDYRARGAPLAGTEGK